MVVKLSASRHRSGRTRKKARKVSEAERQTGGVLPHMSAPELEGPVEVESDNEEKIESGLKSHQSEIAMPHQPEHAEPQPAEHAQAEPAAPFKQIDVKPQAGQKSGGKRVAENREGVFENFTKINESVFGPEAVKKAAAWYIETSEKLANQALELQEKAMGWAKDTPFAPLFEAQSSLARKFVEQSANAARTLWQIQPTA
jgi:phasin protein